jgi:cell division protein DivIC
MRFVEIINQRKITLISIFLFIYVALNLFIGERGLISYIEKKNIINHLNKKKQNLTVQLNLFEKKNRLLTDVVDTDYLEILFREKFMVGKVNEKIYIIE